MAAKILQGEAASGAAPLHWDSVQSGVPLRPACAAGPGADAQARIAELERELASTAQQSYREGQAAGAQQAVAQIEPLLDSMARAIGELAALKPRLRREAESDLVRLSLAIARRVLRRELTVDPDALAGIVKAALDRLDARQVARIRVHPADVPALERRLSRESLPGTLEFSADPALERGAALFETAHGLFDASVETQLKEIERGFVDLAAPR